MALAGGALALAWVGGILGAGLLTAGLLLLLRWFMQVPRDHKAGDWVQPPLQGPRCTSKARLEGKVVVITGANTGIGRFTALDMSRRGAKVVLLCRNLEAAEAAAEAIRKETEGEVVVHK
jgi:hypothetical protein